MPTANRIASVLPRLLRPPTKAGGLVVRRREGTHQILLVSSMSRRGAWTLPKGTRERGEHPVATAIREIAEEAGVEADLLRSLGTVTRDATRIAYFLFLYRHEVDWPEDGIRERRWVALQKAERYLRRPELHPLVASARRILEAR